MTTSPATWEAHLAAVLSGGSGTFQRVVVLERCRSTQDEARSRSLPPGSVLLAIRQTHGRGRHGRAWLDTGSHGVAMTLVWGWFDPARIGKVVAVATAEALATLGASVAIKAPNDIVAGTRKVAGILVEQSRSDDRSWIGIGVNVSQDAWPPALTDLAVSLHQLDVPADRLAVIDALILEVARWLEATDTALERAWARYLVPVRASDATAPPAPGIQ